MPTRSKYAKLPWDVLASTGGDLELIGTAASVDLQLGKIPFSTLYPALSVGGGGHLHAAWERSQEGIFYAGSSSGGASFTEPIPIALDSLPLGKRNSMARICASRGDSVYVFWQYESPGEPMIEKVLFSRSLDGGASFSPPRAIIDQGNPLTSTHKLTRLGDAQVDVNGTLYVMGIQDGSIDSVVFMRSTNGGATFALIGHLPWPGEGGICPKSFVVGDHGDVNAVIGICGVALYGTRSSDGGRTWSSAVNISGASGPVGEPRGAKIILDATGTPVVVWFGSVGGSTEIYFARLLN